MKRNIYSKLWMIFFVLMGAACTNQVEDAIPVSGQPIEFSVQSDWKEIPNTRLNDGKTQFKADDKIQIFGFHRSSSGGVEKVQKFMYRVGEPARGQKVVYNGKDWNYSPKRFWPKEGTLDFYASYPDYSVRNEEDKMTYVQPNFNPLGVDLLWGLATNRDCATVRKKPVQIWMVHALAKVNIFFDSSLGDIKQAKVSAYKAGYFKNADNGVPIWHVDDKTDIIQATIPEKPTKIGDVTVFILPDRITGLKLTLLNGKEIDVSYKIQNITFDAGKEYNLTISKGVQKKNTNSRSIAMSVRCVSE
jgi:hypothetical protein